MPVPPISPSLSTPSFRSARASSAAAAPRSSGNEPARFGEPSLGTAWSGGRNWAVRGSVSRFFHLTTVCALIGCGSDGNDRFSDLVGSGIGTFGEPGKHECEVRAESDCEGFSDYDACHSETLETCATEYYLRGYAPEALPACDPSQPVVPISADLRLALFRGVGIRDNDVVPHAQGLQRYYEPHDLWMTTADVAEVVELEYALSGSEAKFQRALSQAGIDPEQDEDAAIELIGRLMFEPTREFLTAHAMPAWAGVNIVVIGKILSPELAEDMQLDGTVVGLGLSAALLQKTEAERDTTGSLNTMLDISGDFTPSLFVGHADIEALGGSFDLVVAHELGHALGLTHVDDLDNLMEQGGSQSCRRWLSESQVEEMGPFSEVIPADTALTTLSALPRMVVQRLAGKNR